MEWVVFRRGLAALALLIGLAGAASAARTLTVCSEASPEGFDVTQYTSSVNRDAVGATVFDQLLEYRQGLAEVGPGIAERWDISADGLDYTLHLRPGVQFQTTPWFKPTRPLNADDVLFSLHRLMDRDSPWRKAAPNGFVAWESFGMASLVANVDKLDPTTVRLHLRAPNAAFLTHLAQFNTSSVYSAEYGAQLLKSGRLNEFDTRPVGTGPFMLQSYQKDAVLRLAAHPGYWGGAPQIDQLVFAVTPDANVRIQRLKAGECLVGSNLKAETIGALDGSAVDAPGTVALLTTYISLNTTRPYLSDRRFREALRLAFDQPGYIQAVYGGKAQPAASFLPPPLWSYDASLRDDHDPERAKALVRESGYDGREFTVLARIGGSIDARRAGELMQADWARIGVKVRVQSIEWGEMLQRSGRGDYDITFYGWVGGSDPDNFLTPNFSCAAVEGGNNASRWCNKAFDAVLDDARASSDRGRRTELYRQAQRMLHDEAVVIPTAYPLDFIAVNRKVQGFLRSPMATLDFRGVSLKP